MLNKEVLSKRQKEYHKYLNSRHWIEKRRDIINMRGGKCEYCGEEPEKTIQLRWRGIIFAEIITNQLHVHHLNYNHLGYENYKYDVRIACKKCHKKIHNAK